jgi:hypothetical protein
VASEDQTRVRVAILNCGHELVSEGAMEWIRATYGTHTKGRLIRGPGSIVSCHQCLIEKAERGNPYGSVIVREEWRDV